MDGQKRVDAAAIGQRVRQRRKALGLSQRGLARRVGVSVAFVSCMEKGERLPSLETLARLADCLEMSLDELALGCGPCMAETCPVMGELRTIIQRLSASSCGSR